MPTLPPLPATECRDTAEITEADDPSAEDEAKLLADEQGEEEVEEEQQEEMENDEDQ